MRAWLCLLILNACQEAESTRRGPRAPSATAPSAAVVSSVAPSSGASAAFTPPKGASASPSATPLPSGSAAKVGGRWMRCFGGFQPRTDPTKDVLRLATMCGPSNGMRALSGISTGKLLPGQPAEHSFSVAAGDCFRVFAVGSPAIRDLDVEILDRRGRKLAADALDDRWPVVGPAGPVCAVDTGRFRAVVSTPEGGGDYAVQIWVLK